MKTFTQWMYLLKKEESTLGYYTIYLIYDNKFCYIGETYRTIEDRLCDHLTSCCLNVIKNKKLTLKETWLLNSPGFNIIELEKINITPSKSNHLLILDKEKHYVNKFLEEKNYLITNGKPFNKKALNEEYKELVLIELFKSL